MKATQSQFAEKRLELPRDVEMRIKRASDAVDGDERVRCDQADGRIDAINPAVGATRSVPHAVPQLGGFETFTQESSDAHPGFGLLDRTDIGDGHQRRCP